MQPIIHDWYDPPVWKSCPLCEEEDAIDPAGYCIACGEDILQIVADDLANLVFDQEKENG